MRKDDIFKFKQGVSSSISVLMVLGILVVLSYLSYRIFMRVDLTQGKLYSLSSATKKIVKNLNDPVIIKAYFSKNLPAPYNSNRQYIKDLLSEYRAYSKGKIKFQFIDPAEDEKTRREAQMMGIAPIRVTQVESDKYEMKEGYMGLAFLYEDKKEVIPFIKGTITLEYDMTSRIKKIIQDKMKSIGFLTGSGEINVFTDLPQLGQLLSQQYNVKNISFKEDKSAPEVDSLIILLPKEKLTDWEKYKIDQFLMKGKPIGFLLGRTDVNLETFQAKVVDDNLDDLLEYYGVKIRKGLVLDSQCQMITVQTRQGFFSIQNMVKYPFFPLVTSFEEDNPIVKDLERVTFPFINPLEIKEISSEKEKGKLDIKVIAKSSKASWYKESPYNLNPLERHFPMSSDEEGPFNLAVIVKGKFESFYGDKKIPSSPSTVSSPKEELIKESPSTRIFVVGNAKFIDKEFFGDRASMNLSLNIIDWLTQDEDLISIRSKEIVYRPLKEISKGWKRVVKYIDIFLVPIMFVAFGLICWRIRRFRRAYLTLS